MRITPGPESTQAIVEAIKAGILIDIERGVVPASVRSFTELHNYVDANDYGGEPLMNLEESLLDDRETYMAILNAATSSVNAWLSRALHVLPAGGTTPYPSR